MISLSLDESGKFENLTGSENEPSFIAGVLYDDNGIKSDTKNERSRIEAYYKAVIDKASSGNKDFCFPSALHSDGNKNRDRIVVGPVKEIVNETISEFLQKGTFSGRELLGANTRKGKYYIYVILKSDPGVSQLLSESVNFLLKDDYASNLYFHMANTVISRMLFHNPVIDNIKEVSLDIATRKSEDLEINSERANQYRRQGFTSNEAKKSGNVKVFFGISNADIYRSSLSEEMLRSGKTMIAVERFEVKPINYYKNKQMEFLYLADSICSILKRKLKGNSSESWLKQIHVKANQINNPSNNIIIAYDEIDIIYQKIWHELEEKQYYEALKGIYDAGFKSGAFVKYYMSTWFKNIINRITEDKNPQRFISTVNKLHETLTTNELDQDRTIYILKILERMIPNVESQLVGADSLASIYKLYDIGVSAYCHIGDSKNAWKYFNKCKKYAYKVSIDSYLSTLNRIIVTLLDNFDTDKALKIALENVEYNKLLTDLRNELPIIKSNQEPSAVNLAIAYSQLAQVYAFRRDSECKDLFNKALNMMRKDSADYKITQSYLLHYLLDSRDFQEYEKQATDYFGDETSAKKRFEYIMKEGLSENPIINYKYALYIYIKGVYLFEQDRISESLLNNIFDIEKIIKKHDIKLKGRKKSVFEQLSGHPSELIFKYIALLAIDKNNKEAYAYAMNRMDSCLANIGSTINAIMLYGKMEIFDHYCDTNQRNKYCDELCQFLQDNYELFKKKPFSTSTDDKLSEVSKIMTFMYI